MAEFLNALGQTSATFGVLVDGRWCLGTITYREATDDYAMIRKDDRQPIHGLTLDTPAESQRAVIAAAKSVKGAGMQHGSFSARTVRIAKPRYTLATFLREAEVTSGWRKAEVEMVEAGLIKAYEMAQ